MHAGSSELLHLSRLLASVDESGVVLNDATISVADEAAEMHDAKVRYDAEAGYHYVVVGD